MKGLKLIKGKKRRGFTLAELVIVVTILGVLSGLGFAKFGQVQKSAKMNADYVAASSLATAASLAIQDDKANIGVGGSISISKLIEGQYISVEPKPQSIDKAEKKFLINIDENKNIYVYANNDKNEDFIFYPKGQVKDK